MWPTHLRGSKAFEQRAVVVVWCTSTTTGILSDANHPA